MKVTQTMLRSRPEFKNIVKRKVLEDNCAKAAKRKVRRLVFHTHDLGVPLDNLTRDDYYSKAVA